MVANQRKAPEFSDSEVVERAHYMVMYRAHLDCNPFYPGGSCDPAVVARMIERGHVEPVPQGYRMTAAGRQAWAQMCAYIAEHAETSVSGGEELKSLIAEAQGWRKYLTPGQEKSLRDLLEHPRAPGHFNRQTLDYLLRHGLVEWDMQMIAISEKGVHALQRYETRTRRKQQKTKQHNPIF